MSTSEYIITIMSMMTATLSRVPLPSHLTDVYRLMDKQDNTCHWASAATLFNIMRPWFYGPRQPRYIEAGLYLVFLNNLDISLLCYTQIL